MPTRVRELTTEERAQLVPILEQLHTHIGDCEKCQAGAAEIDNAADYGSAYMCDIGRGLYRRWERWLSGVPPF